MGGSVGTQESSHEIQGAHYYGCNAHAQAKSKMALMLIPIT